jgi:hypothetical protein
LQLRGLGGDHVNVIKLVHWAIDRSNGDESSIPSLSTYPRCMASVLCRVVTTEKRCVSTIATNSEVGKSASDRLIDRFPPAAILRIST